MAATAPGAPTGVSATPGNAQASVSWTAPASDGGSPITSYSVTSSPPGASLTVAAPATSATVTGLTNGTTFDCSLVPLGAADAFAACTSPLSKGPLADGTYVFKVTATDPATGQTSSPAVYDFAVNTNAAPSATAPTAQPQPGGTASTKAVPVTISWSATACTTGGAGCNIASYHLQKSINGLAFFDVALPTPTTTSIVEALTPSPTNQATTTSYRYQVQATDTQGNVSPFAAAPSFTVATTDDNGSVSYSGAWSSSALAGAFGGAVHSSSTAGSFADLPNAFSGTGAALISTLGPDRGLAEVTLDGRVVATVDLYAPTQSAGNVVWSIHGLSAPGTHTLKVTVLGTHNAASSGARVDVDGFLAIK